MIKVDVVQEPDFPKIEKRTSRTFSCVLRTGLVIFGRQGHTKQTGMKRIGISCGSSWPWTIRVRLVG